MWVNKEIRLGMLKLSGRGEQGESLKGKTSGSGRPAFLLVWFSLACNFLPKQPSSSWFPPYVLGLQHPKFPISILTKLIWNICNFLVPVFRASWEFRRHVEVLSNPPVWWKYLLFIQLDFWIQARNHSKRKWASISPDFPISSLLTYPHLYLVNIVLS